MHLAATAPNDPAIGRMPATIVTQPVNTPRGDNNPNEGKSPPYRLPEEPTEEVMSSPLPGIFDAAPNRLYLPFAPFIAQLIATEQGIVQ